MPAPAPRAAPSPPTDLTAALAGLHDAIEALPGPAPGVARRVEGRVRDVAGAPVAGVRVILSGRNAGDFGWDVEAAIDGADLPRALLDEVTATLDPDLDALRLAAIAIRDLAWRHAGTARTEGEAVTDAAGLFTLDAPGTGVPFVSFRHDGYAFEDAHGVGAPSLRVDARPLEVIAIPAGRARVRVLLPDGSPATGAVVYATPRPLDEEVDGDRTVLLLAEGEHALEARLEEEGGVVTYCEPVGAVVVHAGASIDLDIRLRPRVDLRVRLAAPPPPVVPFDHRRPSSSPPQIVLLAVPRGTRPQDVSGREPKWTLMCDVEPIRDGERDLSVVVFRGLRPGTYAVFAEWGGGGATPAVIVEAVPGLTEVSLEAPGWEALGGIRGIALGPDGEPLEDAAWFLPGDEELMRNPLRGGDVLLFPGPAPEGERWGGALVVEWSGRGKILVPRSVPPAREVTVRFVEPRTLHVRVTPSPGAEGMQVGVVASPRLLGERPPAPLFDGRYEQRKATAIAENAGDDAGVASLGPLQPGAYIVTVVALQSHTPELRLAAVPVEVREGVDTTVTIPLPPLHEVVLASDARVGALVHAPGDDPGNVPHPIYWPEVIAPEEPHRVRLPEGAWELRWGTDMNWRGAPRAGFVRFRTPGTDRVAVEVGP